MVSKKNNEKLKVIVPCDVPILKRAKYVSNYRKITQGTGNLMLFAGDQKVEHLNADFFGKDISIDDCVPDHLFQIASAANIGVFAAQMGLIARYGMHYKDVPYLVKMNSKSNVKDGDPISTAWYSIKDVVKFQKKSGLKILGVGYTIYLGSEHEDIMFHEAAQLIKDAHENGLVTVIWMYPRGGKITSENEKDPKTIAGACGIAACLGADFVKVNMPVVKGKKVSAFDAFKEAILAAGRTKVVCDGSSSSGERAFLKQLHEQIHISGTSGNATGRNVHQKSLREAIRFCNAINAIAVEGKSVDEAMKIYTSKK